MNCPSCGAENPEGRVTCQKCFARLTGPPGQPIEPEAPKPQVAPSPPAQEQPASRRAPRARRILPFLVILAVVGGPGWWFSVYLPSTPKGVVVHFLSALEGMYRKGMLDLNALPHFVVEGDVRKVQQLTPPGPVAGGPANPRERPKVRYQVVSVSREGDKFIVKTKIPPESGSKVLLAHGDIFPWVVVKQHRKWRIDLSASISESNKEATSKTTN